jgi:subtilisin family serine protease
MQTRSNLRSAACLLVAVALAHCSSDNGNKPNPVPTDIALLSGDHQVGPAGTLLQNPIIVKVTDADGNAVKGVPVTFGVQTGGGFLSQTAASTDPQGRAATQWTLGPNAGTDNNAVTATANGLTGSPVTFHASGDPIGTLGIVSGDAQQGGDGTLLAPLVVLVQDNANIAKPNVLVTWQVISGGGSLSVNQSLTNLSGQASVDWTLGPGPGTQTVRATSGATNPTTLDFSATTVVAAPSTIIGVVTPVNYGAAPPAGFGSFFRSSRLSSAAARGEERVRPLQHAGHSGAPEYVRDELLVTFKPGAVSSQRLQARSSATAASIVSTAMRTHLAAFSAPGRVTVTGVSPVLNVARLKLGSRVSADSVARALAADPAVLGVRHPVWLRADGTARAIVQPIVTPNDPNYPNQSWHYGLIGLPEAWNITTGSSSVIVAVVDNGIRFDHPAVAANLRLDGYDFVSQSAAALCSGGSTSNTGDGNGVDPDPTIPDDWDLQPSGCLLQRSPIGGHGLHVTGTIGAVGNDGVTVVGVNWHVSIRPVRVLGLSGGSDFDVAQGILYAAGLAADNGSGGVVQLPPGVGARIINMSLGGGCPAGINPPPGADVLHDAVVAATDASLPNGGSLIVAAAGNGGSSVPECPAAYPEVISVVAVGPDGTLASYSSFGSTVDIAAPGGNIEGSPLLNTAGDGTWGIFSSVCDFTVNPCVPGLARYEGTSMAAPHVSGVAALLLADDPSLTQSQLRSRLLNYAVPAGSATQYGHGIVNARNSLLQNMGPTHSTLVRLYDAATLAQAASVTAAAGQYTFNNVPDGTYYVFAGEDDDGDGILGLPGRRWGAYGGTGAPRSVTVSTTTGAFASFNIGNPLEHESNDLSTRASVLISDTYQTGSLAPGDGADYYKVVIANAGTYTFQTSGFNHALCSYGMDLNTNLQVFAPDGTTPIGTPLDDIDPLNNNYCSREVVTLGPGTYFVRITAGPFFNSGVTHQGRYFLEVH